MKVVLTFRRVVLNEMIPSGWEEGESLEYHGNEQYSIKHCLGRTISDFTGCLHCNIQSELSDIFLEVASGQSDQGVLLEWIRRHKL